MVLSCLDINSDLVHSTVCLEKMFAKCIDIYEIAPIQVKNAEVLKLSCYSTHKCRYAGKVLSVVNVRTS